MDKLKQKTRRSITPARIKDKTEQDIFTDLKILTPKTFAELFGDDGGDQRGRYTEETARKLFKSAGFPAWQQGRNFFVTTENAVEWLRNSGGKKIGGPNE